MIDPIEAKIKDVYFKGLLRNKIREENLSPYLQGNYYIMCQEMVMKTPNEAPTFFYEGAAMGLKVLLLSSTGEGPVVTFE